MDDTLVINSENEQPNDSFSELPSELIREPLTLKLEKPIEGVLEISHEIEKSSKKRKKRESQLTEETANNDIENTMKRSLVKIVNISNQSVPLQFSNNRTFWLSKNQFIIKDVNEVSKSIRTLESKMYLSIEPFNAN